MRRIVYVDTDPGADDAVALLYLAVHAARGDIDLVGVGSVFGNVNARQAAVNAVRLLAVARQEVPVAVGADRPIRGDRILGGEFIHGPDGLGGVQAETVDVPVLDVSAAEHLVASARLHPGRLSVLALGPLTNLALALDLEPALPTLLERVVWMGGRVRVPGNLSAHADANTLHDAYAAERVLSAGLPLTVVPMDVTQQAWVDQRWLDRLAAVGTPVAAFAAGALDFYVDQYTRLEASARGGARGCVLHDPLAAVLLLEPGLAAYDDHAMLVDLDSSIAFGSTLVDLRGYVTPVDPGHPDRPTVAVARDADVSVILERVIAAFETGHAR